MDLDYLLLVVLSSIAFCISLQNELKQSKNIFQFKKRCKEKTMDLYEQL